MTNFKATLLSITWSLVVSACLGSACAPERRSEPRAVLPGTGIPSDTQGPAMEQMPGLRHAFLREQQAKGASDLTYHFRSEDSVLVAQHQAMGYRATVADNGLSVWTERGELQLGTARLLCKGAREGSAPGRNAVLGREAKANQARVVRPEITEWYENGPMGIEHGIDIAKAPDGCDRDEPLRLSFPVGGFRVEASSTEAAFLDNAGERVLRYTDLVIQDHAGRSLTGRLRAESAQLVIEISWRDATFPLHVDPLVWMQQQQQLWASNRASGDFFGYSVALSADWTTALIGAVYRDDPPTISNGAAYVFVRNGQTWTQQKQLLASDQGKDDYFGSSVALSSDGNTALIGAIGEDDGGWTNNGAAYVFVRSGANWSEQRKIQASDKSNDSWFGFAAALSSDGNTALIGAPQCWFGGCPWTGAAYVFVRVGTSWSEQQKVLSTDIAMWDRFGVSVALSSDGNTALVGAWGKNDGSMIDNGAAYAFTRSGTKWTQEQRLLAGDNASGDAFGFSVALSSDGNTALIGAAREDDGATTDNGAAYVFTRLGTTWSEQQKLLAATKLNKAGLGYSAALSSDGNTALVGAGNDDMTGMLDDGKAYVFTRAGTLWSQRQQLLAASHEINDAFGHAVALSADGTAALIGAAQTDYMTTNDVGTAYVFRFASANGDPCSTWSDCASGNCVDSVCCDSACGGGVTTDCQACSTAAGSSVNGLCKPLSSGAICRAAVSACDIAEVCNGTSTVCPFNSIRPVGYVCRGPLGLCDVSETCDGSSTTCPSNVVRPAGTVCRAPLSVCDVAESCDGASPYCPADAVKADTTTVCRPAVGPCDRVETCDGKDPLCPTDARQPNTYECRPAAGDCDIAELCNGTSTACPADARRPAAVECRAAAGVCDVAESCDGASAECPADAKKPARVECRASVGVCDVAELCDGTQVSCPGDRLASADVVCRASTGPGDPAEVCSGNEPLCPADVVLGDTAGGSNTGGTNIGCACSMGAGGASSFGLSPWPLLLLAAGLLRRRRTVVTS